jgi:intraflagellar transport protein 57
MSENILEKLKILNYEKLYCRKLNRRYINRIYFALPGPNAFHQFDDFMWISAWLCSEITGKSDTFIIEKNDDPSILVNKLLLTLRSLDFRSSFPPQKLRTAYGEPVCFVLDFLTDKALTVKGFEWKDPIRPSAEEVLCSLIIYIEIYI